MIDILNKEIDMILSVDPADRTPEMIYNLGILIDQRDTLENK